jgi:hypothetical protein
MEIKKETYKAKYTHITKTYSPKCIMTIVWPDISDEENERRMERIRKSAVKLVLAADRARAEAKRKGNP